MNAQNGFTQIIHPLTPTYDRSPHMGEMGAPETMNIDPRRNVIRGLS
jgi:hypothetical protein